MTGKAGWEGDLGSPTQALNFNPSSVLTLGIDPGPLGWKPDRPSSWRESLFQQNDRLWGPGSLQQLPVCIVQGYSHCSPISNGTGADTERKLQNLHNKVTN